MNIFQNLNLKVANVKVELDLCNFKIGTGVDTSGISKKADLANSKCDLGNLDIDKLKNVPCNLSNFKSKVDKLDVVKVVPVRVDLRKLSDVVKYDLFRKDVYNAKIKDIQDKIPAITKLAANTTL